MDTNCPYHGAQTWTIEKFIDPGSDFHNHGNQTVEDGAIYISCSKYLNVMKVKRTNYFDFNQNVTLAQALGSLSGSTSYGFFIHNCKNAARRNYSDIKNLNGQESYYY